MWGVIFILKHNIIFYFDFKPLIKIPEYPKAGIAMLNKQQKPSEVANLLNNSLQFLFLPLNLQLTNISSQDGIN